MNKNIFKTLLVSFIVLFSAIFINIDGVKADCTCYYSGGVNGSTNSSGINISEMSFAKISYTNNGYSVTKSCNASDISDYSTGSIDITTAIEKCSGVKIKPDYSSFSKVDYKSISQNCSIESCNSVNVYKDHSQLKIGGGEYRLNAISEKNFNQAIESRENLEERQSNENDISKIINWGKIAQEGEYTSSDVGSDCNSISEVAELLNTILWIVDIIAIVILIIMTAVDLVRAVIGSEEDTLRSAFKHLIVRIIVVFILLLLPILLGTIISIVNKETGTVQIGDDGKPFCDVRN